MTAEEADDDALRKRRQRSHSSPELTTSPAEPEASSSTAPDVSVKRREANRLAAQRFRSRKKGYQDSLEERIRVLEDERDGLSRRLGESLPSPGREAVDTDTRIAALQAANRRLRDEVGSLLEDNERLREELEAWRRWHHDRYRTLPPINAGMERPQASRHGSDIVLPPLRIPPLSPAISESRSLLGPPFASPEKRP